MPRIPLLDVDSQFRPEVTEVWHPLGEMLRLTKKPR